MQLAALFLLLEPVLFISSPLVKVVMFIKTESPFIACIPTVYISPNYLSSLLFSVSQVYCLANCSSTSPYHQSQRATKGAGLQLLFTVGQGQFEEYAFLACSTADI